MVEYLLSLWERTTNEAQKRSEFASKKSCRLFSLFCVCICRENARCLPLSLASRVVVIVDKAKMTVLHATSLRTTRWKESQCCQQDFKNDVLGGRKRKHHVHADASKCEQVHSYLHTRLRRARFWSERFWRGTGRLWCTRFVRNGWRRI